jgi:hypothetical protein
LTSLELEQKARRIQAVVEEHTLQEHGMLPMLVRSSDYQLPTAEDYKDMAPHRHLLGKTEADLGLPPMHVWRAWENTSADTGFYLGAMSYQYRCTGDPAVLAICKRTLGALKYIYDLGAEFDEPGFLCKPYGGVATNQTSGDQLQCVSMGLDAYRRIAGPEDAAVIGEMFVGFADYQMRHAYRPKPGGYFAHTWEPWDWSKGNWSHGLIYVPVLYHAWLSTGDGRYLEHVKRWYDACAEDASWLGGKGGLSWGSPHRMLYLPSLMMELDPWQHDQWRRFMSYVFGMVKVGVLPDGTAYSAGTRDPETGAVKPLDPGWGGGATRTGRITIFGWACVNAQRWLPDEDMVAVARIILEQQDLDTFRFVMPAVAGESMPTNWRCESELLDHDCITSWLWMYWEGRYRGYW